VRVYSLESKAPSCNCCADAAGWVAGEWSAPWTHEGVCYTGQPYAACEGAGTEYGVPWTTALGAGAQHQL
jgi:hypothetical protein